MLQLLATLVVAAPVAVMGAMNVYHGLVAQGVIFLGLAVGIVVASEYVYERLTDRTVGRVRRLTEFRR